MNSLLPQHQSQLGESGIPKDVADDRGYESVCTEKELAKLGFTRSQQLPPGPFIRSDGISIRQERGPTRGAWGYTNRKSSGGQPCLTKLPADLEIALRRGDLDDANTRRNSLGRVGVDVALVRLEIPVSDDAGGDE